MPAPEGGAEEQQQAPVEVAPTEDQGDAATAPPATAPQEEGDAAAAAPQEEPAPGAEAGSTGVDPQEAAERAHALAAKFAEDSNKRRLEGADEEGPDSKRVNLDDNGVRAPGGPGLAAGLCMWSTPCMLLTRPAATPSCPAVSSTPRNASASGRGDCVRDVCGPRQGAGSRGQIDDLGVHLPNDACMFLSISNAILHLQVGRIIGRGGATIKELEARSQCRIQVGNASFLA